MEVNYPSEHICYGVIAEVQPVHVETAAFLERVLLRKLNCLSGCFGNKFARFYCQPQKIMSTTSPTSHVQQVSLSDTYNNNNNDTKNYNLEWRSRGVGGGAGRTTTDLSCVCFGI